MNRSSVVERLAELLRSRSLKICVAESVTAGLLQDALAQRSGASDFFRGGLTAYALDMKSALLGVDPELVLKHQGVHPEIAQQMAAGALKLFDADVAIATTGYAEPAPAAGVAEPFAWIAVCRSRDLKTQRLVRWAGSGSRSAVREAICIAALRLATDVLETD